MQLDERLIIAPIRATKSGLPGPIGPVGPKGEPGDPGLPPKHRWVDTNLQFTKQDGSWGDLVNLKGPKGDDGGVAGRIKVEDESGGQADLKIVKYNSTDDRIKYDATDKSLTVRSVEHSYQLDWSVNNTSELPDGSSYIGSIVYVKDTKQYMHRDETSWKALKLDDVTAASIFNFFEKSTRITPRLAGDKILMDAQVPFLGIFETLDDLEKVDISQCIANQTMAIVCHPDNVTSHPHIDMFYVCHDNKWWPIQVSGNITYQTNSTLNPVTKIAPGRNVTLDYDVATKTLVVNAADGGGGPTDLSEYVKGASVQQKYPGTDWSEVEWDATGKILKVGTPRPDFDKMNSVLVAGDNINFEHDQTTGLLKIGADFNPDYTPYVRGETIVTNNGLNRVWDKTKQELTLNYTPTYDDLTALIEAGSNVTLVKGIGEKVKIDVATVPIPDLAPYAKKANITIPTGFWGTVEVDGEDVKLKVGLSAKEITELFAPDSDVNFDVSGDKVKVTTKDGKKRLYAALAKSTGGNPPILKAGDNIEFTLNDTARTIEIKSTAKQFTETSVKVDLPLTSTFDATKHEQTIGLSPSAFVNLTDQAHSNVRVEYDASDNKIKYNVDTVIIPIVSVEKDSTGAQPLSKLQVMNAGDAFQLQDDSTQPGKKIAVLTMHDKYQVMGHFNGKDEKLTELTLRADVPDQVDYTDGHMVIDLTKTNFLGRVAAEAQLPTKAIKDKSYAYVASPNGYDTAYIFNGTNWDKHHPSSGMLLATSGSVPAYNIIKQIKNTPAVSIDSNGELTINQGGLVYRHNGTDEGVDTLEVTGAGVAVDFDKATGALKLDIAGAGGSTTVSPLKITARKQDGSTTEYPDTRELVFDGDVEGLSVSDLPGSGMGKKITLPTGVIVENDPTVESLKTKYDPDKYKGKLVYGFSNDAHLRAWFACDGEEWFILGSKDLVAGLTDQMNRFPVKVKEITSADVIKDETSWTFIKSTADGVPEYTRQDGTKVKVDGFIMNVTTGTSTTDRTAHQTFLPIAEFQLPQYRNWNPTSHAWRDWKSVEYASGDVIKHNEAVDAHEAIFLPAVVATSHCSWFDITNGQSTAGLKNNVPLFLVSDNTGLADIVDAPSGTDKYSVIVPRTCSYNLNWTFQITGKETAHGTLNFQIIKNGTNIIMSKSKNIGTQGKNFDAYLISAPNVSLVKGDKISVHVSYSGDSAWSEADRKEARIDAMKNTLTLEHVNSKSATLIAKTNRRVFGSLVSTPGYEAQILPDMTDPTIATFVEVTGSTYSTTIERL